MIKNNLFDSYPLAVHASVGGLKGRMLEFWEKLRDRATRKTKELKNVPNITVVTWNNLKKGCFEMSCEQQGVDYIVLGADKKQWSNYYKLQLTVDLLESTESEYVLACDSHDALLLGDPLEIVARFQDFECDILFCSECRFYPNLQNKVTEQWKAYQTAVAKSKFAYLSAGTYVGKKDACIEFLTACNKVRPYELFDCSPHPRYVGREDGIGCDQSTMQHTFPKFYPRLQLDYFCKVFQTLAWASPDDVGFSELKLL